MTAITCPGTAAAATVTKQPSTALASVTQAQPVVPAAALLSGSLLAGSLSAPSVWAAATSAAANAAQWEASYRSQEGADRAVTATAMAAWGHAFVLADIRASAVNSGDVRLTLEARQAAARAAYAAAVRAAAARAAEVRAAAAQAALARAASARAVLARSSAARQAAASAPDGTRTDQSQGQPMPYGSPQQIAQQMLDAHGQGGQFYCLESLWRQESGWNVHAQNPGSGAYGIPQALPGSKMASAGPDWQSNPATQIAWGLSYIDGTYGSPCAAWTHEQSTGWY